MDLNRPKWTKLDQIYLSGPNGPKWTKIDQNEPKCNVDDLM